MNDPASTLYGTSTPPVAAPAPATPAAASVLYAQPAPPQERADTSPEVAQDRAGRLYAETAFADVLPDDALPGLDVRETRLIASELGCDAVDVAEFVKLDQQHVAAPATAEQVKAWREETDAEIRMLGIPQREVDAARRLVQSNPHLKAYMDETGAGSRWPVVKRFIELARQPRNAQRGKH